MIKKSELQHELLKLKHLTFDLHNEESVPEDIPDMFDRIIENIELKME